MREGQRVRQGSAVESVGIGREPGFYSQGNGNLVILVRHTCIAEK